MEKKIVVLNTAQVAMAKKSVMELNLAECEDRLMEMEEMVEGLRFSVELAKNMGVNGSASMLAELRDCIVDLYDAMYGVIGFGIDKE